MDETARKVRSERQALGWSQETLAKKAGCDVRTVRRLEAGARVSPATIAEVTSALKRARPPMEVKALAGSPEAGAAPPTVARSARPENQAMKSTEEATMVERQNETGDGAGTAAPETMGELLALHEKDPEAAEQVVLDMMPKSRAPERTEENLTSGHAVMDFLERFPDAQVYVVWDTEDMEQRKTIAAFIRTTAAVEKAIQASIFDSAQRYAAQCEFADELNALHKHAWFVSAVVTRSWNLEGDSLITGVIAIDKAF